MTAAVAMRPDGSFEGQPRGFPFDDFEFEDVMLPEGDDMGIASEDDEVAEEELETETGFGSVIGAAVKGSAPDRQLPHGKRNPTKLAVQCSH